MRRAEQRGGFHLRADDGHRQVDAQRFARREAVAADRQLLVQLKARVHAAVDFHLGDDLVELAGAFLRAVFHFGIGRPRGVFRARFQQSGQRVILKPHLAVHIAPVERAVVAQGFQLFLLKVLHMAF